MGVPAFGKYESNESTLQPFTDTVCDSLSAGDGFRSCTPSVLRNLVTRIERGTCRGLPCHFMTDDEFVQHVKAGDFDE